VLPIKSLAKLSDAVYSASHIVFSKIPAEDFSKPAFFLDANAIFNLLQL
jgi:hypothetical protein